MNSKYIVLALALALNIIGFSNCSKVGFTAASKAESASDTPIVPPAEVVKNCQTALANGSLKSIDRDIVFENTRTETGLKNICPFDVDDNLSQKNEFLRARYTQEATLEMPAGAVICGAEMETAEQSFEFDDMFFLTFNDYVLASSIERAVQQLDVEPITLQSTGKAVGLYHYDWLKVRNATFKGINEQSNDYCLGAKEDHASCVWPLSQQKGKIRLNFDPELLINIGLRSDGKTQRFGFVVTGDNDPAADCFHQRLAFQTKVYYYVP